MLVSDVLNIVKSKALGRDNYNPDQEFMLLNFFNLAHFELWDALANLDDTALTEMTANVTSSNMVISTDNNIPIKARLQVFNGEGRRLRKVSSIDVVRNPRLAQDKNAYVMISPSSFRLTYVPLPGEVIPLTFFYTPEAVSLNLNDDLNNVYPEKRLQYLLADGTFYHLCFSEEGTRPIRQQDKALIEWKRGIASEQASLLNGQSFSTEGMW